jgi:uncharacterized membrane protein
MPIVTEDLGALPDAGVYPEAHGISGDGVVVVGRDGEEAFRWTQASGIQILRQPNPADPNSNAEANWASADGSLLVGDMWPKSGGLPTDTLVWNLSGAHRLRDLLVAAGVTPTALQGWVLGGPGGVSADGKVVVGGGVNPSGQGEAWIARLP